MTQYTYGPGGGRTQEIDAYGTAAAATTMAYDNAGNLASETTGQSSNQSYAHPSTTEYGYDALNRRTSETDAYGTAQQRTEDKRGRESIKSTPDPFYPPCFSTPSQLFYRAGRESI